MSQLCPSTSLHSESKKVTKNVIEVTKLELGKQRKRLVAQVIMVGKVLSKSCSQIRDTA